MIAYINDVSISVLIITYVLKYVTEGEIIFFIFFIQIVPRKRWLTFDTVFYCF